VIVAVILLAYAAILAVVGPRLLMRATWTDRAPRLGIIAWQSLSAAVVGAVVLAGIALTFPTVRVSAGLADLLRACVMALRAQYATPGGAAAGATGVVLAVAVLSRCGYCVLASLGGAARGRSRHREVLALAGQPRPDVGAVVLGDATPAVYCLPGRQRRIVVTAGALELLDDQQLAAALAHERAHMDQRHDLVIAWAAGLARAFPRLGLFRQGLSESRRLIELLADDVATRSSDRLTLAEALLNLAGGRTPAAALGVSGGAAARVQRLIAPHRPLSRRGRAGTLLSVIGLFVVPMIALATPAVAATDMNYCPTHASHTSQATAAAPHR
jgi:hypothetical protein